MIKRTLAVLGALAIAGATLAQQGFALRKTDIRAAYLHLQGDHAPVANPFSADPFSNAAPHIWYNLDSTTSIKPAGWNIYNPLSPGALTGTSSAFFSTIFAGTPIVAANAIGPELTKRQAGYWWLNVADLSDDDMDQLDVALLQVTTPSLRVSPGDRERLRRFVEKGGILWVDLSYGSLDQANGLPMPLRSTFPGAPDTNPQWDFQTPLLRYPNSLTSNEIQTLTTGPTYATLPVNKGCIADLDLTLEGAGAIAPLLGSLIGPLGDFGHFKTIMAAANQPTAVFSRIGDGFVVVTSRGVSEMANRSGPLLNRGFYAADPSLQLGRTSVTNTQASAALKFMVNVISLGAESSQSGAGSRKNTSSFVDVGAPLLQTFSSEYDAADTYSAGANITRPPVIYKGFSVVVSDHRVYVYDADPRRDADGYGNNDDGFADLSLGEDKDLVWASAAFGDNISSAVCAEIPEATAPGLRDLVMVTTGQGQLAIFGLYDNARRLKSSYNLAPDAVLTNVIGGGPFALGAADFPLPPTVNEGIAYIADTVSVAGNPGGRIWQADLRRMAPVVSPTAANNFMFGGTTTPIQRISGGLTVGHIPIQDSSGGLDRVIYAPLAQQATPAANAGLMSIWAGVKGERPVTVSESGGVVSIYTRAAQQGGLPIYLNNTTGDSLGFRISITRTNGTLLTAADMAALFSGAVTQSQGTVSLVLNPLVTWPPVGVDPDNGVRVDYSIDWGAAFPTTTAILERGRIQFPTPSGLGRNVVGGIALSPTGTVYATVSSQVLKPEMAEPVSPNFTINNYNGSLFALREEGRGNFRCAWKWDLYPQHSFSANGSSQTWQTALPDNDPLQNLAIPGIGSLNFALGGGYRLGTLQGAPVIRNGEVYVTVSGAKRSVGAFQVPASAVLCFADDASTREIRVNRRLNPNAIVVQPDIARSADPSQPSQYSSLSGERIRIEKEPGEVGGVIRLDNLMTAQRGQISDSISVSQPVIIRQEGAQDFVYDPGQTGDRWNPLKWYTILHGTQITSTAFDTGNTLFVSGKSILPAILNSDFNPLVGLNWSGVVFALKTDFDSTQAKRPGDSGAFTVQPVGYDPATFTAWDPQEVIADQARPYLRQAISMDYVRSANSFTSSQASLDGIRPSQIYVWPQTPRNTNLRGVLTFDDYVVRVNQCEMRPVPINTITNLKIGSSLGVVAGDGLLMSWSQQRVHGFRRANTWVADEGRMVLLDPSGNPVFDSSRLNISGATGGNTNGQTLKLLTRPSRVYPISGSADALVVETDRSVVMRMSPTGAVNRELGGFTVDASFIPSGYKAGDPTEFSKPRDAWTWTTQETPVASGGANRFAGAVPARPLETWIHYLVADQGNGRMIEVVDRYNQDPATLRLTGRLSEGTLIWHSPKEISGQGWGYNSFTRLQVGNRFVIVAGIGSKSPAARDTGIGSNGVGDTNPNEDRNSETGNGGIVIFDPNIAGGYRVFNKFSTPAVSNAVQWDWVTGAWSANPAAAIPARDRVMSNLQSVTASIFKPTPAAPAQYSIVIADSTGVYELTTDPANPINLNTRWMLPSWAYGAMRRPLTAAPQPSNPRGFFPTYARRLDDDNVMIVNGYVGLTRGNGAFTGEVLQVDGSIAPAPAADGFGITKNNLGFYTKSIRLRFGPVEGTRGLSLPVFADRR